MKAPISSTKLFLDAVVVAMAWIFEGGNLIHAWKDGVIRDRYGSTHLALGKTEFWVDFGLHAVALLVVTTVFLFVAWVLWKEKRRLGDDETGDAGG